MVKLHRDNLKSLSSAKGTKVRPSERRLSEEIDCMRSKLDAEIVSEQANFSQL